MSSSINLKAEFTEYYSKLNEAINWKFYANVWGAPIDIIEDHQESIGYNFINEEWNDNKVNYADFYGLYIVTNIETKDKQVITEFQIDGKTAGKIYIYVKLSLKNFLLVIFKFI